MALKSQLQLSGRFLHNLYVTRSKIFNIVFLALVSYLPQGLFSLSVPLYLQIHHPKSYPGFFLPFLRQCQGFKDLLWKGPGCWPHCF